MAKRFQRRRCLNIVDDDDDDNDNDDDDNDDDNGRQSKGILSAPCEPDGSGELIITSVEVERLLRIDAKIKIQTQIGKQVPEQKPREMTPHLISSQSLNLGGPRDTTDDVATLPFHHWWCVLGIS